MRKGQIGLEYLLITAFAAAMIGLAMTAFFTQSSKVAKDADFQKIDVMGTEMIEAAKQVFYAGGYSKQTLKYAMPNSVLLISVPNEHEIMFTVNTDAGSSELVYFSDVPIEGSTSFPLTVEDTQLINRITVQTGTGATGTRVVSFCTEEFASLC